jgi:hypothetical protein
MFAIGTVGDQTACGTLVGAGDLGNRGERLFFRGLRSNCTRGDLADQRDLGLFVDDTKPAVGRGVE